MVGYENIPGFRSVAMGGLCPLGLIAQDGVDRGEKWGHFGGSKGTSDAVTIWRPTEAEKWASDRGFL